MLLHISNIINAPSVVTSLRSSQVVPVLNFELAEKYVNIRRAFDLLDVNSDGMLSTDELEEQVRERVYFTRH